MDNLDSIAYALDCCGRQLGKTYQVAQACKNIGATMICANEVEAKRIAKEYSIKTVSMNKELRGSTGPFLIDNHAVAFLCFRASDEIEMLTKKLVAYREAFEELSQKMKKING